MLATMDYREVEAPSPMQAIVRLAWNLTVPADGPGLDPARRDARRLHGDHPPFVGPLALGRRAAPGFVAGLITGPQELELSAGSSFVAVRIWPWAARLIGRGRQAT